MKDKGNKALSDKGLSLVEIIVAIAVGSIVLAAVMLLVVQGVKSYRSQSTLASLQNDVNIALNQMSDNIMEGTCLSVSNLKNADGEIYTSYFQIKDNVYYVYEPDEKILYQSQTSSKDSSSSVLCENVEGFSVKILDYSILTGKDNKVYGMTNPIQLRITVKAAKLDESREAVRSLGMRNDLSQIELIVEGMDDTNINIIGYDISSLENYITSDN